jgi:signal transduction histidine kinase
MTNNDPHAPGLLSEETNLADAGEAAGVFLHELGNVLNNLLLSARLLQRQLPDEFHEQTTESCRLISEVAGQMQQLAKFRQGRRTIPYPVDLHALVRDVIADCGQASRVMTDLASDPAQVLATTADVRRLLRLLVQNALAVSAPDQAVSVRTLAGPKELQLVVEDNGPTLDAEQLRMMFEPFQYLRSGQSPLDLAICKNLVRRGNGQLEANLRPGGQGLRITASWPLPVTR